MTRNNLDNPFFLFLVLLMAITINTIFSIHFLLIMFAGILFTAFYRCLRKRYLYSLAFVIIAFLFIYIFILPSMENSISYNSANAYIYIIFFYIGLIIMWTFYFGLTEEIFGVLIINTLIDLIFLGVFLWT